MAFIPRLSSPLIPSFGGSRLGGTSTLLGQTSRYPKKVSTVTATTARSLWRPLSQVLAEQQYQSLLEESQPEPQKKKQTRGRTGPRKELEAYYL